MDDRTRAVCHEAGHLVVGLHYGFNIEKVQLADGRANIKSDLDSLDRTVGERYNYLAGGIAGEKFFEPNSDYDHDASGQDQMMITERRGGPIEDYLPEALEILRLHENALRAFQARLKTELTIAIAKARMAAQMGVGGGSHRLLSGQEIKAIWTASDQR